MFIIELQRREEGKKDGKKEGRRRGTDETHNSGSAIKWYVFPGPGLPGIPPLGAEEGRVGELLRDRWVEVAAAMERHWAVAHGIAFQHAYPRRSGRPRKDCIGEGFLNLGHVSAII